MFLLNPYYHIKVCNLIQNLYCENFVPWATKMHEAHPKELQSKCCWLAKETATGTGISSFSHIFLLGRRQILQRIKVNLLHISKLLDHIPNSWIRPVILQFVFTDGTSTLTNNSFSNQVDVWIWVEHANSVVASNSSNLYHVKSSFFPSEELHHVLKFILQKSWEEEDTHTIGWDILCTKFYGYFLTDLWKMLNPFPKSIFNEIEDYFFVYSHHKWKT